MWTRTPYPKPLGAGQQRSRRESGNTILEFALVAPFLILTFFSTAGLGIMMGRYIQAVHVCRDIAHMYVDGVDFSLGPNRAIVLQLAQGTGMTVNGGNGVVILSRVITVFQADCNGTGVGGNCNNVNQAVITQRLVVGNAGLRASAFGTPTPSLMDAQGNIPPAVYLQNTDPSVRATGFSTLLTTAGTAQQQGDAAWVAEVFFTYPDIGYLGTSTAGGAYARFIF